MNNFNITFNSMPKINITGQIPAEYFIEIYEYVNEEKELITDFTIPTNNYICFLREWYGDYDIHIWEWNEKEGLHMVASHRYDDKNKKVLINLDTYHLHEALIWTNKAIEYRDIHGCELIIKSSFKKEELCVDSSIKIITELNDINEYYAIYNIGKYDTEFEWNKKLTETVLDKVWNKNRTYCSYRNPRDWHYISIDDVAGDILGLNEI